MNFEQSFYAHEAGRGPQTQEAPSPYDVANVTVGESIGLIHSIDAAAALVDQITSHAASILGHTTPVRRLAAPVAL